ncbi:MAG: ABC transporter substrate-binding protein [Pseudonocardiaceae bacterium]
MSRRALASWTALLVAIVLITTGCADAPDSDQKAELVWAAVNPRPALAIAERWNELHPMGPKVRVETLPEIADDQRQLMALELNAGLEEFDILEVSAIWTVEFAQNGWLVELAELRADIERLSLPVAVQTAIWDGQLWAAPYNTSAGLLYYRSDLVEKPPTTWEDLIAVGRRVGEERGIAPFVADGAQYEGVVVQYLEYFWGAGGEMLESDGQSVLFQPGPALRAANFMNDAYRTGLYAPGFNTMTLEDARSVFQSGQAVFMRSWPYVYRRMNSEDPDSQVLGKVGIAPLPTFEGSEPVTALGGHNLVVSRFSDDVPAATEFVRFASTSWEAQRKLADLSVAPTLEAVYDDLADDRLMALLDIVLPTARPRPAVPEWSTISEEMQQQIFAAYTGDPDPKPEIDALSRFLDATIKER